MRLQNQLMLAIVVTGAIGTSALVVDRIIVAQRVMEQQRETRAYAIGETLETLIRDDAAEGRWSAARKETKAMARLPGVAYILVFDKSGNAVIKESAHAPAGGGTLDLRSAMISPDSGGVIGGVQVGMRRPKALGTMRPFILRGAGLAALALLALAFVARSLSRRLTRRLNALTDALDRADDLKPIALPESGTKSELDRLSRAFNSLHARLLAESERRARVEVVKNDLTNMLVHDMKHPLTVLKAALAYIEEWDPSRMKEEKRSALLRMADNAISRENGMIDDLLQFSRLENTKLPVRLKPFAAGDLLEECAETNRAIVENSGRKWQMKLTDELRKAKVAGDRIVLKRIIGNLVLNAVEHTPEARLISLEARLPGKGGPWVEISVQDEGPGVPAARRDAIFRKYETFAESARNVGLGLAFCKMAAERLSGRLVLASDAGHGARFSILLPLHGKDSAASRDQDDAVSRAQTGSRTAPAA